MAHGIIVSLAGGTLHGRLIEKGNVSMYVSSIETGAITLLMSTKWCAHMCLRINDQIVFGSEFFYQLFKT